MAFDDKTRRILLKNVTTCRSLLTEDFDEQLRGRFGIYADEGRVLELDRLTNLTDKERETARILRDRIDHLAAGKGKQGIADAVHRIRREQAFTVLNRFAALRMAEERGVIRPSVGSGFNSTGFQIFERAAGSEQSAAAAFGSQYDRYLVYLDCLFDELSLDLGVLFDRSDAMGLLVPSETALIKLLKELNSTSVTHLWAEDETIGWIYQYYNDPEERKTMRKESAAPRNSRELAVRNQFFTPRYVVEFLTDNTLGRIWYEMTKGQTRLATQCRYLVRRPSEIFLSEGETGPEAPDEEGLSQEELLKQPVYIHHRPLKDPREIRLLDPACGSMHFGLYAFDLFEIIYEEAWDNGFSPTLRQAYASRDEFLKDIPRLIIEHNIHGIDIDPRATQIAALSLWLRAQKAWKQQKLPASDRPRVRRSNIVCAEPMPGSPEMLGEFVATLNPPLLGELVKTVFDKMQLAGEAGSLLKIEEEIRTAIDTARKEWLRQQDDLLTRKDSSQEEFFDTAEQQVIDALRAYAEQADTGSYQRRLFADDAARGFAFIDLCRKRYDAVVMNPPFGEASVKSSISVSNPSSCSNLYCAFVIESMARLNVRGRIGAITDRSFVVKSDYEDYREWLYSGSSPEILIDLGWEVLDANVEVCIYVVSRDAAQGGLFASAANEPPQAKESYLLSLLPQQATKGVNLRFIRFETFRNLPNSSMSYALPHTLLRDFEKGQLLGKQWGKSARGMSSGNTAFACRLLWEIPQSEFGYGKKWNSANVGGGKAAFYRPTFMVFYHDRDWGCMKEFKGFSLKNTDLFWKPAIGWGKRTDLLSCQLLSSGTITAEDGQLFKPTIQDDIWMLLAFLNSKYAQSAVHAICGGHKGPGYVGNIPLPSMISSHSEELSTMAKEGYAIQRQMTHIQETSPAFVCFKLGNESNWIQLVQNSNSSELKRCEKLLRQIDEIVFESLGKSPSDILAIEEISPGTLDAGNEFLTASIDLISASLSYTVGTNFGRWDIRLATGERQPPESPDPFDPLSICPPGMLQNTEGLPAEPQDVPSDYPMRISWSGILVDDENHSDDIVARVREAIEVIWKDRAEAIEAEACEILEVKAKPKEGLDALRVYFRDPNRFFKDHLARYSKSRRKAPIYWPLSTESGSYTLWIYYHRLSDQTLFRCIEMVDRKREDVGRELETLRSRVGTGGTAQERQQMEEEATFLTELKALRDRLHEVTRLPYHPNLNDGVQISAAPLWQCFRHGPWQKILKETWTDLSKGKYDWAHLAMSIWPERVKQVCERDRSIAIAHGCEDLCKAPPPKPAAKRASRKRVPEVASEDGETNLMEDD
jgi:hypothetical protein